VVWAVGRPTGGPDDVSLYAFDPDKGTALFSGVAGSWPNTGGDSNIVPVVANGKVYVATNQSLAIFGIAGADAKSPALPVPRVVDMRLPLAPGQHEIYGVVASIAGNTIVMHARDGRMMTVDATASAAGFNKAQPRVGHAMIARGTFDEHGTLQASIVLHAKDHPVMWPADR
jgi:hypothetical protein